MGDLAAGTYPLVTDSRDGQLTYQLDEISPKWPDGSMRHCVISAMVPADASRACTRLKIKKTTAPYAPSSTPRSVADFTTRNFLVHYRNVLTNPTAAGFPSSWTVNWSRKGSNRGNFTFSLNNAISAGRYKVVKNGPVCIEIWAWGFLTDDANDAADPHLFCEYYCTAYSDPSNSVNVLYFEHWPKISQPMLNPTDTSVNVVIGSASLYDGVTKLRDLTDDAVTLGPSDVFIGGSGVPTANFTQANTTRALQTGVWYRVHVQPSCTPPGGMTDGMLVMTDTSVSDKGSLNLYTKPHVGFGYNTPYSVQPRSVGLQSGVASGHNSLKLTPRQACCYYMGFYITANDNGDPILTPGRWANPTRFLPNLDGTTHDTSINSQKAYWQATGLVPPWDITLSANCASMDGAYWGFGQGPFYRPFSNGPMRTGIDGGGDDWNTDGPWAEWDARWFMRMGATNWSPTDHVPGWVAGLCNAHMGQTQFLRQSSATSHPILWRGTMARITREPLTLAWEQHAPLMLGSRSTRAGRGLSILIAALSSLLELPPLHRGVGPTVHGAGSATITGRQTASCSS